MEITAATTATPVPNPAMISSGTVGLTVFIAAGLTVLFFFFLKILFDLRSYRYR